MRTLECLSSVSLLISVCVVSESRGEVREVRNITGCGTGASGATKLTKIQGGSPSGPWPWLCGLEVNRRLKCGATIIQTSPSQTILLSAAHCVEVDEGEEVQVVCANPHLKNNSLVNGVTLTVRDGLS